jgi:hypothetical protein
MTITSSVTRSIATRFPESEFIAHEKTREYLPTTGLANRQAAMSKQGYPAFIDALESAEQE